MKKVFLKSILLLCALIVGSSNLWGQTFNFQQNTEAYGWGGTPASGDASTCTLAEDDKFTNGDIQFVYSSKGGASTDLRWWNTSDGLRLYGAAGPKTNHFIIKALNGRKIKSVSIVGTFTLAEVASPVTGSISKNTYTAPSGGIVEVEFMGTHTSGQKNIKSVTVTLEAIAPTITFSDGNVNVGQNLDLTSLFSSNSAGDVTYSIISGDSYANLAGATLTGIAPGSVTIQASQAASPGYNAGSATATITVQEALELSSISVTTIPTKTAYIEGETFDPAGMVVTATYSNSSTSNVTAFCSFTPSGALTLSDDEVTISYTENAVNKTTTQAISVTPYIQPTVVELSLNNAFFGTSYTGADAKGSGSHSGSSNNVVVNFNSGGDTKNFYISDTEIRAYSGNTLEFVAPDGFVITNLTFASAWASSTTTTPEGLNGSRTAWLSENGASSVSFTPASRSDITTVSVTLSYPRTTSSGKYGTICFPKSVSSASGVEKFYSVAGFRGTANDITSVIIEEVATPLIAGKPYIFLANANSQTFNVTGEEVATPNTIGNNGLVGQFVSGQITDNGCTYILKNNQICLVEGNEVNCPAFRAYFDFAGMLEFSGAPDRYIEIPCAPNSATNIDDFEEKNSTVKFFRNNMFLILRDGITYDVMGRVVK